MSFLATQCNHGKNILSRIIYDIHIYLYIYIHIFIHTYVYIYIHMLYIYIHMLYIYTYMLYIYIHRALHHQDCFTTPRRAPTWSPGLPEPTAWRPSQLDLRVRQCGAAPQARSWARKMEIHGESPKSMGWSSFSPGDIAQIARFKQLIRSCFHCWSGLKWGKYTIFGVHPLIFNVHFFLREHVMHPRGLSNIAMEIIHL